MLIAPKVIILLAVIGLWAGLCTLPVIGVGKFLDAHVEHRRYSVARYPWYAYPLRLCAVIAMAVFFLSGVNIIFEYGGPLLRTYIG